MFIAFCRGISIMPGAAAVVPAAPVTTSASMTVFIVASIFSPPFEVLPLETPWTTGIKRNLAQSPNNGTRCEANSSSETREEVDSDLPATSECCECLLPEHDGHERSEEDEREAALRDELRCLHGLVWFPTVLDVESEVDAT